MFKEPLLGAGGGVAGVHEDPVVAFAAVHAAAAHGVVQRPVLQNRKAVSGGHSSHDSNKEARPSVSCRLVMDATSKRDLPHQSATASLWTYGMAERMRPPFPFLLFSLSFFFSFSLFVSGSHFIARADLELIM